LLVSTSVFAAWQLLKPSEVADIFEDKALSAAFASEDAVNINETIVSGKYKFTLLAAVAGEDLTDMPYYSNGEIQRDRLYAVLAVQYADGSPMPSTMDVLYEEVSFFSSPLIKGVEPTMMNVPAMNGGGSTTSVIDGVLYRIVECDNVAVFADKGLYFAINTGTFFSPDAFIYNEETGEITANANFDGESVIFNLPLDKKYADPAKAEQYFKDQEAQRNGDIEHEDTMFDDIDWENAMPVEGTIADVDIDSDGYMTYTYAYKTGGGAITAAYSDHFSDDDTEQSAIINMMASDDDVYAVRMEKDENGGITGMIVVPR